MKTSIIIFSVLALALCANVPDAATSAKLLQLHNNERRMVGLTDLTWSATLTQSAQDYANKLAATGTFQHSGLQTVGENLAQSSFVPDVASFLFKLWADEKAYFIPSKPFPDCTTGGVVGHYTQIMWSTTTQVGCGIANTTSASVLVCHYSPPGNRMGQYVYTSKDIVQNPNPNPSNSTPSNPTPSEPTPSNPTPVDPAPSNPTPSDPTPSNPTPSGPTPSNPPSTNSTPAEPTPSQTPLNQKLLDLHNAERRAVKVNDLTWSSVLEATAQNWANYLAQRTKIAASGTSGVGENIGMMNTIKGLDTATFLFNSWSSQKKYFDPSKKYPYCAMGGNVSYYTQIVWSQTTQLGCGMAQGLKTTVLVCLYKEKGNKNGFYVYPVTK